MLNVLLIHEKIRIPLPPALCNIFSWTKGGFSKMSACVNWATLPSVCIRGERTPISGAQRELKYNNVCRIQSWQSSGKSDHKIINIMLVTYIIVLFTTISSICLYLFMGIIFRPVSLKLKCQSIAPFL